MKTCAWCACKASTSRDGQPACYWCADHGLDDVPCDACKQSRPRPDADLPRDASEQEALEWIGGKE